MDELKFVIMNLNIQSTNITVSDSLNKLINKKVSKLQNFHTHILSTSVYLNNDGIKSKEVQIKLNIKNQTLFCKEKAESFEQALEFSVDCMKRQLKKHKQKK